MKLEAAVHLLMLDVNLWRDQGQRLLFSHLYVYILSSFQLEQMGSADV